MHSRVVKWEQRRSWQLEFRADNEGKDRKRGRGSYRRNAAGECRRRLQLVLILAASCGGCRCRQGTQLGKVIRGGTPRDRDAAALMIIEASVNDLLLFSFRLEELLSGLLALHTLHLAN